MTSDPRRREVPAVPLACDARGTDEEMKRCLIVLTVLVGMLSAGCGGGTAGDTEANSQTTAAATEPTAPASSDASDAEFTVVEDYVYAVEEEDEYLLDVYAPIGDGPFPVMVAFHGLPSSKDDQTMTSVAEAAAKAGMLVFVPNWNLKLSLSPMPEDLTSSFRIATCALVSAEAQAPSYSGDPNRVVTYGFSAGGQPAAWMALGQGTESTPGCVADQSPIRPIGGVLGDSEYFLHNELFQDGFDVDPEGMLAISGALINPNNWPDDLNGTFRIWSAENGTSARSFDDPWAEDGWLAQRDPDGSIRHDLEAMGQLDDGVISNIDESMLLAERLETAGQDATHDLYPGGHDIFDKVPELVAYLLEIAGEA